MNITIVIPDEIAARVLDGFATAHGFSGLETQEEFLRRKLIENIKSSVFQAESTRAAHAAAQAKRNEVERDIVLSAHGEPSERTPL